MIYIIGSGYIGSSLADHFSDRGYDMTVLNRGDIWPLFKEEDTIINCASSGYRKKDGGIMQTVQDNFALAWQLDQVRNGSNLIHFSTWVEEAAPELPYAAAKLLATRYLEGRCHICVVCSVWGGIRESPEKFMGTFLKACSKDEPYVIYQPYSRRDFIHVDAFCHAVEALTKHKDYAKRYFATGTLTSFFQVYAYLRQIAGRDFPNVRFAEDFTSKVDWRVSEPFFENTLKEDLEREWRKLIERTP